MHIKRVLLLCAAVTAFVLGGCSNLANIHSRTSMTAEDLKPVDCPVVSTGSPADSNCAHGKNDLERTHDLLQDSQQKCNSFVVGMFASNAKTSTYLDVATTSLTALATVFTPLSTVHALTAGGTITSGTKTSIQNNYLNALTLSHIVQAVQTTYSSKMADYIAYLDGQTQVDVYAERSTILAIHGLCSLPQAEGSIQATLAQGTTPASTSTQSGQLSFGYTVGAGDTTPAKLAASFAIAFSKNAGMRDAGLSAQVDDPAKPDVSIILDADKLSSVTWKEPVLVGVKTGGKAADPQVSAAFSPDDTALIFGGSPQAGEVITIKSDVITLAKQPAVNPAPKPVKKTAPAKPKVLYGAPVTQQKKN